MSDTELVYELFIRGTPGDVWSAITDGAKSAQYFFGTAFSSSLEVGAPYRYAFPDGSVAVDGRVRSVKPGERLEVTWKVHYDPSCASEESVVTWTVEARGPNTKLSLVHDCTRAPATAKNVANDGWSLVLSGLKSLVETGRALELAPPAA